MKPRTKKFLFAIVGIVLICVSIGIYWNIVFRKEYALSSSITVIENGEVTTVDFATGKIEKTKLDIENLDLGEETVFANGGDIYSKENGKWVKIFSSEFEIAGKPLVDGDTVYFIAPEIDDEPKEWHRFYYLWKAENGKAEKFHENPVRVSDLLLYEDKIIFVEEKEVISSTSYNYYIVQKNIVDSRTTMIDRGIEICWKDEGETFFYINRKGNQLCLFDLQSNEAKIIEADIDCYSYLNYNKDEKILLIMHDRPEWKYDYCEPMNSIYYLDSGELIYIDKYFDKIILGNHWDLNSEDFSAGYWN